MDNYIITVTPLNEGVALPANGGTWIFVYWNQIESLIAVLREALHQHQLHASGDEAATEEMKESSERDEAPVDPGV